MGASRKIDDDTRHSTMLPRATTRAILVLALIGALLLIATEPSTISSVEVKYDSCEIINDSAPELADRCSLSGFERHGGAFLLLAGFVIVLAFVAAGANRAAAAALVAIGLLVLAITLFSDLPVTSETGAIGLNFKGATAEPGLGLYLELTAGVLCLLAGLLALLAKPQVEGRPEAGPARVQA